MASIMLRMTLKGKRTTLEKQNLIKIIQMKAALQDC